MNQSKCSDCPAELRELCIEYDICFKEDPFLTSEELQILLSDIFGELLDEYKQILREQNREIINHYLKMKHINLEGGSLLL